MDEPKRKLSLKREAAKTCPSCHKEMPQNTFICRACGLDTMSGKKIPMALLRKRG